MVISSPPTPCHAPAPNPNGRQETLVSDPVMTQPTTTLHISDRAALAAALRSPYPVLTHINADTTWLLHLPYPEDAAQPVGRRRRHRFNVLLDPWLQGPQSDVASWFSTQWHVVAPSMQTISELNALLGELEREIGEDGVGAAVTPGETQEVVSAQDRQQSDDDSDDDESYIDVVAISHEFTDHCHEATLRELPRSTPVFAPDKAAALIRSWKHFDTVVETPAFLATETRDWRKALSLAPLPPWVGIGRVVTPGNALYYHSAVMVAWVSSGSGSTTGSEGERRGGDAVIYSPHGIHAGDLAGVQGAGLRTLALLHGLDDVRIWMAKQLNLGAVNGVAAARECGAKYWVATHDEVKKGGGFIAPLLRRTRWSVADAVKREGQKRTADGKEGGEQQAGYEFVELGSGDGLVFA
ncbi:hypothetical protein F5Y19DRAFT_145046 [Xylariaceae sp. FL1651]|nr:hypothetical protein F5Y19DRAFT_145046 [Xylariaceae sp. FL1651]